MAAGINLLLSASALLFGQDFSPNQSGFDAFDATQVKAQVLPSVGLRSLGVMEAKVEPMASVRIDADGPNGAPGRISFSRSNTPVEVELSVDNGSQKNMQLELSNIWVGPSRDWTHIPHPGAPYTFRFYPSDSKSGQIEIRVGYVLRAGKETSPAERPLGIKLKATAQLGS